MPTVVFLLPYLFYVLLEWRRVSCCSTSGRHTACRDIWTSGSVAERTVCAMDSIKEVYSVWDDG